eukprot:Clim_evm40s230 gene=Clim_evmTU40s230
MGISGLLPLLKDNIRKAHVKEYKGKKVGVDAYGWLHRGVYRCAREVVLGKHTTGYVDYCIDRCMMLKHFGVKPVIVFDGGPLPAKKMTEDKRRENRQAIKRKAMLLEAEGKKKQAVEMFQKCCDVTPQMALSLIRALRKRDIEYLVAPYEADSQLAYLYKNKLVDGVISEDSDMLVFGIRHLLLKLDREGNCDEIAIDDWSEVTISGKSLRGWTQLDFMHMCILSGCDYLDNVKGMGLKKAFNLLWRYQGNVERVIKDLGLKGVHNEKAPVGYLDRFREAVETFLYQQVFDPKLKQCVPLNSLPEGKALAEMPYAGSLMSPQKISALAEGRVNPLTGEELILTPSKQLVRSGERKSSRKRRTPTRFAVEDERAQRMAAARNLLSQFGRSSKGNTTDALPPETSTAFANVRNDSELPELKDSKWKPRKVMDSALFKAFAHVSAKKGNGSKNQSSSAPFQAPTLKNLLKNRQEKNPQSTPEFGTQDSLQNRSDNGDKSSTPRSSILGQIMRRRVSIQATKVVAHKELGSASLGSQSSGASTPTPLPLYDIHTAHSKVMDLQKKALKGMDEYDPDLTGEPCRPLSPPISNDDDDDESEGDAVIGCKRSLTKPENHSGGPVKRFHGMPEMHVPLRHLSSQHHHATITASTATTVTPATVEVSAPVNFRDFMYRKSQRSSQSRKL